MEKIPYSRFKHGQKVTCKIDGEQIDDAKVSIDKDGDVYVCQNKKNGVDAENKLGYEYSWRIFYGNGALTAGACISAVTFLNRSIEDVQEGDIVASKDKDERKVLGVCGECVHVSYDTSHEDYNYTSTKHALKLYGYTIKQDTPPTLTEVTLQEVADKMGVPVEQLRIKE